MDVSIPNEGNNQGNGGHNHDRSQGTQPRPHYIGPPGMRERPFFERIHDVLKRASVKFIRSSDARLRPQGFGWNKSSVDCTLILMEAAETEPLIQGSAP